MVALDLGGSGIRAVQFTVGKGAPVVEKVGRIALPDGAIVDGEVKDPEVVGDTLKQLWSQEKFSSKQVVFGVANAQVQVRIKTLDWDIDDDFRKSLKYQPGVAEEMSFDVDKANLDYHTLYEYTTPTPEGEERRMKAILLVAAEQEMVDAFVRAIQHAGLHPVACDLTPFALIRSVKPAETDTPAGESVEVIIDMGLDVTNVILHQNGQPRLVRIVARTAGRHLTKRLAEHFTWSEVDAERAKIDLGLTGGTSADGVQHPAQQVINHVASAFITEIRTTIDYFLSSTPQVSEVSRVVLTGGGSNIKGFKERLASELRVQVEFASPAQVVTVGKKVVLPEGLSEADLAVALGLATGMV